MNIKTHPLPDSLPRLPYAERERRRAAQRLEGAIFEATWDLTHPLAYGFRQERIPVFKDNLLFVKPPDDPYASPLLYTQSPLMSGYISEENLELMKGSASVVVHHYGQGKIISLIDNPNFRAFWYGTNKLFANALFLPQLSGDKVAWINQLTYCLC
ncbi:MAG: hypothetical protein HC880_14070 [Bacteroidia bacterium]|nr:hypothetical protein [Bacteroidia bacterium]